MNARTLSRRRAAVVVAIALLYGLIATGLARADEPLGPLLPGRPLASRVAAPAGIADLQSRLNALLAMGGADCEQTYQAHKAQAWLNFASYAGENGAPPLVRAAAAQYASGLLDGVEEDTPISIATDELPGARHERDDLWRSVDAVRRDGRLCAEPKMAAYCEVQLAWAGYEATTGGWRHVDPYVRIAEDYCVAAIEAAPLPYTARMVRNEPRVIEPVPRLLDFDLPAIEVAATLEDMPAVQADAFALFVLFPHNRSRPGDIRPPGRRELAQLARQLSALPAQTGVSVVGHADITGHVKYNAALSARRARSVALELAKRGVDPTRIRIGAAGSARPVVKCPTAAKHSGKSHYLQCLEPNRRVVVELIGAE